MAEKIRKSQEEEIIQVLKREGFIELNERDLQKERDDARIAAF